MSRSENWDNISCSGRLSVVISSTMLLCTFVVEEIAIDTQELVPMQEMHELRRRKKSADFVAVKVKDRSA